jgi:hypothetical protein
MMAFLSMAWWIQKLSGIAAQAIYAVVAIAVVIGGLFWIRHDARLDERNSWQLRMANARIQQLALRQKRERDAMAIGSRAEKNLVEELDVLTAQNAKLEAELLKKPVRPVVWPREMVKELNR